MRLAVLMLSVASLIGCRSAAFTIAEHRDTEDGWRSYLADHDQGVEADAARERLELKVWDDVRLADTRLAFRRYLDEFPDGAHADEALDRLKKLRNRAGENVSDLDATEGPAGTPGAAAAALAASAGGDPTPLRAYLARFPDSPNAGPLVEREDDLSFVQLRNADGSALRQFAELHPRSRHREEVEALLGAREVRALAWEERFADAIERLNALPPSPMIQALGRDLCERRARALRASASALADLGSAGLALVLADDDAVSAISRGLVAEGALDVINTEWTLADTGVSSAVDPLLASMGPERSLAVRWSARLAFSQLVAGWPTEVKELELEKRRLRLAARAASASLWIEEAVLEEALGLEEAQVTLAKARHDDPSDPLPLALSLQRADLRDPERSLVAQQLDAVVSTLPTSEGCARQWLGRLARSKPADTSGPCAEGPTPAAQTAADRRLAAIAELQKRPSLVLAAQLGRLAERDGSFAVRAAAKAALAGGDTLTTPACQATASLETSGP